VGRARGLALKGRHNRGCTNRLWRPFRAFGIHGNPPPRALPWAIALKPFGLRGDAIRWPWTAQCRLQGSQLDAYRDESGDGDGCRWPLRPPSAPLLAGEARTWDDPQWQYSGRRQTGISPIRVKPPLSAPGEWHLSPFGLQLSMMSPEFNSPEFNQNSELLETRPESEAPSQSGMLCAGSADLAEFRHRFKPGPPNPSRSDKKRP
jgi:hypothetical protein